MKIGILSDTHSLPLPRELVNEFKKVDLIIHAGDFCDVSDLKSLEALNSVKAVHGNMDNAAIRKKFPRKELLKIGTRTIGIFHGEGARQAVVQSVQKEFKKDKVDAVIFGHSHQPFQETIGGVVYFNPGSPNDKITAPYCSFGILSLTDDAMTFKHVKIKE